MKPSPHSSWPPIIGAARAPRLVRIRDFVLTLAAWGLLFYVLREPIHLTIDYFSHPIFTLTRMQAPDWLELWRRLRPFVYCSLAAMGWLVMWGIINWRRLNIIAHIETPPPLPLEQHAASFGLDPTEIERLQQWRIATVYFDGNRIASARPGGPKDADPENPRD